MEQLLRHVVTRITDEGLVIELFDVDGAELFPADGTDPAPVTVALARLVADVLGMTTNEVAVNGHVRTYPVTLAASPVWELSAARAQVMRQLLQQSGLEADRMQRIGGFADRKPAVADGSALRNNRIEIILLRRDR